MYWAIEHIIEHYLNKRKAVILGRGYNALKWSAEIRQYEQLALCSHSISEVAQKFNPSKHYIFICEDNHVNLNDSLNTLGYKEIEDYYDWTKYHRTSGHLPIDVEYNGTRIGCGSYFSFNKKMFKHISSIGRFCSISSSAIIQGDHSMNRITTSSLYPLLTKEAEYVKDTAASDKDPRGTNRTLSIGNDVWIGANVLINASKVAKIGDGAIIGANSLVLEDVPPYAIVYGTPAKIQRFRFSPDQIEVLLNVKWWEWDKDALNTNIELLMNPGMFFKEFGNEE